MLAITNQEFSDARLYLDSLSHADCLYIQTSGLGHSDYRSLPYLVKGEYDPDKFIKYLSVNDLVVDFVEMINKRHPDRYLKNYLKELEHKHFIKYHYLASTPDIDDLKSILGIKGFTNARSTYQSIQAESPGFGIPEDELVDWANRLKYSGYINEAIEIYKLSLDIYPNNQSVKNKLRRLSDY